MTRPLDWSDRHARRVLRGAASVVARAAEQIRRRIGGDHDALYSENLY